MIEEKKSPKRFAELLMQGYRSIQAREHNKSLAAIDLTLGDLLSLSPDSIRGWRQGKRTPATAAYVEAIAREIVPRGQMDQLWLTNFVTSAGYPTLAKNFSSDEFPSLVGYDQPVSETQPSLSEDEVVVSPLIWADIQQVAQKIQAKSMGNIRRKYDPALYVQRQEAIALFDAFMESEQQILVITGKSGVGKTNFIHALAEARASEQTCFLIYDCYYLAENYALLARLDQDFQEGFQDSHTKFDFVAAFNALSDGIERHFVLIIDGLNEHANPASLLIDIDRTFHSLDIPEVKVILTCRPETWRQINRQTRMLTDHLYYRPESQRQKGFEFSLEEETELDYQLPLFLPTEALRAYEKYAASYQLQTHYFDLNQTIQEMIQDPLILLLISRIYRGQAIPNALHPNEIYKLYIEFMLRTGQLTDEADIFLRTKILPLMMEGYPHRNDVAYQQVRWRCIQSEQDTQCLANLLDVDILAQHERESGEIIRFTFERFYDYFAGKYLLEQSRHEDDQALFIQDIAKQLTQPPYLWGPLMALLHEAFEEQNDKLLQQLGYADDKLLLETLMKLLDEKYSHHSARVYALLQQWLTLSDGGQMAHVAAYIALKHKDGALLNQMLVHPDKKVSYLIVQDIYTLWIQEPAFTERVLSDLVNQAPEPESPEFMTLLDLSFLLFLQEYQSQTATAQPALSDSDMTETSLKSVALLKQIWQPVLKRNLWFHGALARIIGTLGLRRRNSTLHRVFEHKALSIVEQGQHERFSFDFESMKAVFPLSAHRRHVMEQFIDHFDAAVGTAPQSLDHLTELILHEVEQGEENFWVIYTAHLGLAAHLKANPLECTRAITELLGQIEMLPSPEITADHSLPTASIWYPMISHVFVNLGYDDYAALETEEAREILSSLAAILRRRVYKYGDIWRRDPAVDPSRQKPDDRILRLDCLEPLLYGYALDIPEAGRDVLQEFVAHYIQDQDHDHIRWGVYSLAAGMNRQELYEVGLDALGDFIEQVQESGYLETLGPEEANALWQKWCDDLLQHANKYRSKFALLVDRLQGQRTPELFKRRLETTSLQDNVVDLHIIDSAAWLINKATQDSDPNSPVREMIISSFRHSIKAKSAEQVMADLLIRLVDFTLS